MKRTKPSCLTDGQWRAYLSIKLKCELRKLTIVRQNRLSNGGNSGIIKVQTNNLDGAPYGNQNAAGPHNMSKSKSEIGRCNYKRENGTISVEEDLKVKCGDKVLTIKAGSKIANIEDFAGKGCKKGLNVKEHMAEKYGGNPDDWTHAKGDSTVTFKNGKAKNVEVHWFECEGIGQTGMKVKRFTGKKKG